MKSQWKCAKAKREITHLRSNLFPLIRSIELMLGDWEWYFSSQPFRLTQRRTCCSQVCLSAVCVVWRQNNNRKYMTRNLASISTEKYGKVCVYLIAYQTLWKENSLCTPLPFKNLSLFDPPTPSNSCDPKWRRRGGMDIFWNHTIFTCHTQSSFIHFGIGNFLHIFDYHALRQLIKVPKKVLNTHFL